MKRLLDVDWERDYLILQPGEKLAMTYDHNVVGCVKP
jgi:hypothetical protein